MIHVINIDVVLLVKIRFYYILNLKKNLLVKCFLIYR